MDSDVQLAEWLAVASIAAWPWLLLNPRVAAVVFDASNVLKFFAIATVLMMGGLYVSATAPSIEWLPAMLMTPLYQLVLHRALYSWFVHRQQRPPMAVLDGLGLFPDRVYAFVFLMPALTVPLMIFF